MKILVPVDQRTYCTTSMQCVAQYSPLLGEKPQIELLFVDKTLGADAHFDAREKQHPVAQAVFEKARAYFGERYDALALCVTGGQVEDAIAQEAERGDFDLIVMATRGRSRLATAIGGSVTFQLLMLTHRPVLILRDTSRLPVRGMKVGVCVDGSTFGCSVAQTLLQGITHLGPDAQIQLMSVVSPPSTAMHAKLTPEKYAQNIRTAYTELTAPVQALFNAAHVPFVMRPLSGIPSDAILRACEKEPVDLLVLGSHGFGARKGAMLGSVATGLAAESNVPLLIIRPREDIAA